MSRLLAIAWAKLRCHGYLLFWGMWRGECALTCYNAKSGKLFLIAAVRAGDPHLPHIFYLDCTRSDLYPAYELPLP